MHSWLEESEASPDRFAFPDLGETLDSSTRQEMQCCMTPVRPNFLNQFYHCNPENLVIRGIKLAKRLRKKSVGSKKLNFERSRCFDFISSDASLTCVVKSLCAGMKPRRSGFRSGSVSCYEFYSKKDAY